MPRLLPVFTNGDAYDQAHHTEQSYRPAIEEIGHRHALAQPSHLYKYATGSCVVFAYGDLYAIKLYPPLGDHHFKVEVSFYSYLEGKLKLQTPAVIATGTLEGWDYLIMTQLRNPLVDDAWPQMDHRDRLALLFELGEHIAELHSIPAEPLLHTCPDWQAFLHRQRETATARQQGAGTPHHWTRQVAPFLQKWQPQLPAHPARALLHTEICGNCLTTVRQEGRWHLTGLLDCADSFIGAAEYDFASVLLLLCKSDRALRKAFYSGYGLSKKDLNGELYQRIMVYTLLHRYSNLRWYTELQPPDERTKSLEQLSLQWYKY